jgi:predicted cupin superfamily sugar epimerase
MPAGKSSKGDVDLVQKVCEKSSQASVVIPANKCWTETQSSNERYTVVGSHEVPGVHEAT